MSYRLVIIVFSLFLAGVSLANIVPNSVTDHHVHVACFGYGSDCFLAEQIKKSWRFLFYQNIFDFTEEEAKEHGDPYIFKKLSKKIDESKYVGQVFVLAIDQVYKKDGEADRSQTEFYVPNDFVAAGAAKYDNVLFGASVHPYRRDALRELERVKAKGAQLVKLLPAIQRFKINAPNLQQYYLKLKELDLPLLIHVDDENSFSQEAQQFSQPAQLEFPLKLGVKVIAAHAASNGERDKGSTFEILLELAERYPNLSADVSALTIAVTRKGHLNKVVKKWKPERLFYGSDYPLSSQWLSSPLFYILELGFTKAWKLAQISNEWDRDIELKLALGMSAKVFKTKLNPSP
ncbi:amidohydrolase family protein [Bdellovibrionales bacterium]|nr:amidohydrolase family protein [Bdellovibrionales bacterium]